MALMPANVLDLFHICVSMCVADGQQGGHLLNRGSFPLSISHLCCADLQLQTVCTWRASVSTPSSSVYLWPPSAAREGPSVMA